MLTIAGDPKHLGARIGITAVLHTWGSAMTHHPHGHMIGPGSVEPSEVAAALGPPFAGSRSKVSAEAAPAAVAISAHAGRPTIGWRGDLGVFLRRPFWPARPTTRARP